jgi:hypothetical protein
MHDRFDERYDKLGGSRDLWKKRHANRRALGVQSESDG